MSESPATRVICPKCGATILDNANFCGMCGSSVVVIEPGKDPHVGQVVAGRYRIQSRIAAGGMGEIYVAQHETLSQKVAVKLLHRRFASDERIVARFFNEARTYCRVKHPNAVTVLDFGRLPDGTLYIVTEFVDGQSLTQLVEGGGPLPPSQCVRVARQLCEALAAAHGEQIVHRDLKPDNVMVTAGPGGRPVVKILDFGIAKILGEPQGPQLTKTGTVFGTPEFMSPEQAQGMSVSFATDLYALGCVIFYMLTGKAPFESSSRADIIQRHVSMPPPLKLVRQIKGVPPELVQLVSDLLEKRPEERPADMLQVLSRLEAIELKVPEPAAPPAAKPTAKAAPAVAEAARQSFGPTPDTVELGSAELGMLIQDMTPGDAAAAVAPLEPAGTEVEPAAKEPEHFTFEGEAPVPAQEERYTWGGEGEPADSVLGRPLDLDASEAAVSTSLSSHSAATWAMVVLAVAIGVAVAVFLMGRSSPPSGVPAAPEPPFPSPGVLGTGSAEAASPPANTALASPAARPQPLPRRPFDLIAGGVEAGRAAALLQGADVDGATTAWASALALLGDDSREGTGGASSSSLGATLAHARELVDTAHEALRRGDCSRADRAIVEMRQIAPALRRRFLPELNACNERGRPPRTLP